MRGLSRQAMGLGTILWVAALIVVSYVPGFLRAAPAGELAAWSEAHLDALDRQLAAREVHLWVPGGEQVWRLTGAEVALAVDRVATRVLAAARVTGETPSLPVLTLEAWRIRSLLRERVAGPVRVAPVSARLNRQGEVIPDRSGQELDQEEAVRRVREAFLSLSPASGPIRVEVPLKEVRAAVTADRLRALAPWGLLASFTTRFDPGDAGRTANIELGASLLDGTLLKPGELFSFNEVVGPRTEARGFKPAPIIVSRQLVAGIGGGVCQLSSTTYNAALLSGFQVVERRHHSIPVSYLPLGYDATVFDHLIDLRFRNTLPHPVMVQAHVDQDQLTVAVWGHPQDRRSIRVRARVVETLPPPLEWEDGTPVPSALSSEFEQAQGKVNPDWEVVETGRKGYLVEVERIYYAADGQVERVESLSRDLYPPEPRRVRAVHLES